MAHLEEFQPGSRVLISAKTRDVLRTDSEGEALLIVSNGDGSVSQLRLQLRSLMSEEPRGVGGSMWLNAQADVVGTLVLEQGTEEATLARRFLQETQWGFADLPEGAED